MGKSVQSDNFKQFKEFKQSERYQAIVELIDKANREDIEFEEWQGESHPKRYLYGLRMSQTLEAFEPEASEALSIAVRAQHIYRWKVPRSSYPLGRSGYLQWRTYLKGYHAEQIGLLMEPVGYSLEEVEQVQLILSKKHLKTHADTQTLEDIICLVFLQYNFPAFAAGDIAKDEDKLLNIIHRTWKKMSAKGNQAALKLNYSEDSLNLLKKALDL